MLPRPGEVWLVARCARLGRHAASPPGTRPSPTTDGAAWTDVPAPSSRSVVYTPDTPVHRTVHNRGCVWTTRSTRREAPVMEYCNGSGNAIDDGPVTQHGTMKSVVHAACWLDLTRRITAGRLLPGVDPL
ncbi:hypothetical protein HMPREF0682_1422 [Propionibacterium acidifaciens F0233]|uniref:Uncharacterized protein n=1 Tax=Propionibacterium acidifaciens F0233 TaxID=553198 RepID=U2R9T7_9ACTN|nr:hypothetical protein HMPREF0682_1422 [Propionibacterium acidifaciens F0233]